MKLLASTALLLLAATVTVLPLAHAAPSAVPMTAGPIPYSGTTHVSRAPSRTSPSAHLRLRRLSAPVPLERRPAWQRVAIQQFGMPERAFFLSDRLSNSLAISNGNDEPADVSIRSPVVRRPDGLEHHFDLSMLRDDDDDGGFGGGGNGDGDGRGDNHDGDGDFDGDLDTADFVQDDDEDDGTPEGLLAMHRLCQPFLRFVELALMEPPRELARAGIPLYSTAAAYERWLLSRANAIARLTARRTFTAYNWRMCFATDYNRAMLATASTHTPLLRKYLTAPDGALGVDFAFAAVSRLLPADDEAGRMPTTLWKWQVAHVAPILLDVMADMVGSYRKFSVPIVVPGAVAHRVGADVWDGHWKGVLACMKERGDVRPWSPVSILVARRFADVQIASGGGGFLP